MRSVLVCVRTPLAAQSIASCAARLGIGAIRTATSEAEVMARLAEQSAELVLADTAVTRPDPVGFTRRVLARAPGALLLLLGNDEPQVAAAAVAAGARGLVRSGDPDPVTAVVKALLLIGSPRRAPSRDPASGRPHPDPDRAGGTRPYPTGPGDGSGARESERAGLDPGASGMRPGGAVAGSSGLPPGAVPRTALGGRAQPPASVPPATGRPASPAVPVQRSDAVPEAPQVPARRLTLTERELQVLRGMADGKSNAEIGRDLYVSEDTVKTHARRLFRKLGVRDRAHAVAVGFRSGALA